MFGQCFLAGCAVVCECCFNKSLCLCSFAFIMQLILCCSSQSIHKISEDRITVFRCKSYGISSALWNTCMWRLHWFGWRSQSSLTFCKSGKLFPFKWGRLKLQLTAGQERSLREYSVFKCLISVRAHMWPTLMRGGSIACHLSMDYT